MKRISAAARPALVIAMILNSAGAWAEKVSLPGFVGVTVRYKNGNTLEGLLVSMDDEAIVLDVGGGRFGISRRYVESIELKPNRHVEFKEREAVTDPSDAKGLAHYSRKIAEESRRAQAEEQRRAKVEERRRDAQRRYDAVRYRTGVFSYRHYPAYGYGYSYGNHSRYYGRYNYLYNHHGRHGRHGYGHRGRH